MNQEASERQGTHTLNAAAMVAAGDASITVTAAGNAATELQLQ